MLKMPGAVVLWTGGSIDMPFSGIAGGAAVAAAGPGSAHPSAPLSGPGVVLALVFSVMAAEEACSITVGGLVSVTCHRDLLLLLARAAGIKGPG